MLLQNIEERTDSYDDYLDMVFPIKAEFESLFLEEEERWKTLISIASTLQDVNLSPAISYDDKEDALIIRAVKQTGETINFSLHDTKLHYEFDNYEGDACFDASDNIELILQDVYGIQLDDKVLVRGNPDRIKKTAKTNPVAPKQQHL